MDETTISPLRAQILGANDGSEELVEIPEWGVTVLVKSMTGLERAALMTAVADPVTRRADTAKMYAQLTIRCACDPKTGERIFAPSDADALMGKTGNAVETIAVAAMRVNGINQEGVAKAKGPLPTPDQNGGSIST